MNLALHLVPAALWEAVSSDAPFRAESLGTEGFIHLTHGMADLVEVADRFYRDDPRPQLVLTVDLDRLTAPWRYDGDERYPHVYGPIDRDTVLDVRPISREAGGRYVPIPEREAPA